jgi:hypothetical protein
MTQGLLKGLQILVEIGNVYAKQLQAAKQAMAAGQDPRVALVQQFVQGLLQPAEGVRNGSATESDEKPAANPHGVSAFVHDRELVFGWFDQKLVEGQRNQALVDHLLSLDAKRYEVFIGNLRKCKEYVVQNIKDFEANEDRAWGPYFEDRMAYRAAKAKTGQRDPKFMRGLSEFQEASSYADWAIASTERAWRAILQNRARSGK